MYLARMKSGDEDLRIIDAARRGDRDVWESLYRSLYPKLRAFFVRRIGRDHAEDAVNETMACAIAGISGYSPGMAGFDGWIFGIARNIAADHHRRAARDRRQSALAHLVDRTALESASEVDDHLALRDEHARLRSTFARLTPSEQEILELRVVAGLSADQVAAVLNRRPEAVRTAQSRALAHLRRLLEANRVDA
jgi:RNA polymerase sigma-70 factor, ECF subfamily